MRDEGVGMRSWVLRFRVVRLVVVWSVEFVGTWVSSGAGDWVAYHSGVVVSLRDFFDAAGVDADVAACNRWLRRFEASR